ncbi:MAG: VUT family protein [Eubacteriales bacterium]|nr:VUT family protein [Eubacteriales bacterium]
MKQRLKAVWADTRLLFRSIPSIVTALFTISVVAMNILANKTIYQSDLLALDGGILISWLSFLCMDIVTKAFGPKAATKLSVFAIGVNLLVCLIFFLVSIIPTETDYSAFNTIIGGTWFILLSSTIAFLSSAVLNNFLNWSIGRLFRKNPDGKLAYAARCYISTFIGQFFDNFVFSVFTFMIFAPIFWDGFSWTLLQCFTCSLLGAGLELLMEIVFSPLGYLVLKQWKRDGVGQAYRKEESI